MLCRPQSSRAERVCARRVRLGTASPSGRWSRASSDSTARPPRSRSSRSTRAFSPGVRPPFEGLGWWGGTPPAGPKSEAAQPGDDCVIRAPQERGEPGGIERGVEVEQFVLVRGPARAGADDLRCARRREPEPACTAADSLWGAAEQPRGVIDRAQRQDAAEAGVVLGRPPPRVGGESEPSRACRGRRRRSRRQGRGHLVAAEAVGVTVAHDCVLGCAPPSPPSRAMESELAGTEPQRVRAAPESSRERIGVRACRPLAAQHLVLGERVAPRPGPCEAKLASTSTDLLDGSAKAARKRSRRQPDIRGRLAQHRIFERGPWTRRSSGGEAERYSARRDRVLRAPDLACDRSQRDIRPVEASQAVVLRSAPARRHVIPRFSSSRVRALE